MKHTPGPWIARGRDIESKSFSIACANGEANAKLIAAAPDLLEALRLIAHPYSTDQERIKIARAAIAKAEYENS